MDVNALTAAGSVEGVRADGGQRWGPAMGGPYLRLHGVGQVSQAPTLVMRAYLIELVFGSGPAVVTSTVSVLPSALTA